jgi:hypothetical protein
LGFSISYFCWQCLVCLAAFFGLVLGSPWNPEGVKAACLGILGEETARQSPANAERWIVSLLFQEVDVR